MKPAVAAAYRREMAKARAALDAGDDARAFASLERAHIVAQRWLWPHLVTHWLMLRRGWGRRDAREVVGQLLRLAASFPGWLTGWVPKGNTGGSNVSALRPMPLPADLRDLLAGHDVRRDVAIRVPLLVALLVTLASTWY